MLSRSSGTNDEEGSELCLSQSGHHRGRFPDGMDRQIERDSNSFHDCM